MLVEFSFTIIVTYFNIKSGLWQYFDITEMANFNVAGLPLRFYWTIGLPSVGGPPNVRFSFLAAAGFEPTSW